MPMESLLDPNSVEDYLKASSRSAWPQRCQAQAFALGFTSTGRRSGGRWGG